MAWNNSSELVVGNTGQVYVAPVGTTLPTTTTGALNAAFVGLGYTSEDGVTFTVSPTIQEFRAWQSRSTVRRELTGQEITASFVLEQWDENSVPLAFGGGSITGATPNFRFDFLDDSSALDSRAMVIDVQDGSTHLRFVLSRGNVTEAVESQFQRGALAMLPISFKALAPSTGGSPGYFLTDAAGFATGS